jgi:hypothetical protein
VTTQPVIDAVYRKRRALDWREVEIVGQHDGTGQLVLREIGKFWPGVWLAERDQVRVAGPEFLIPGARK